jgi:hypothetical protein
MLRVAAAVVTLLVVPGCGHHPCTLGVGEPGWCAVPPEGAAPFCVEVCSVCEGPPTPAQDCAAQCRRVAGIPELTCEELDADVEAEYRECIETADYPGCGGR